MKLALQLSLAILLGVAIMLTPLMLTPYPEEKTQPQPRIEAGILKEAFKTPPPSEGEAVKSPRIEAHPLILLFSGLIPATIILLIARRRMQTP